METKTINIYQFNELSEEAKQVAIDNERNSYYQIYKDSIEIEPISNLYVTDLEQQKIDNAIGKFGDHCEDILLRIKESIDYRFSDESIIEDIEVNEYKFTIDGEIFNF